MARGFIDGTYTGPTGDGDFNATVDDSFAPFPLVLGSWNSTSTAILTCMDQPFEDSGAGLLRVRLAERQGGAQGMDLTIDTTDGVACDLDDCLSGSWSGNVYTETETETETGTETVQFGDCTARMDPSLRAGFMEGFFDATQTGTATISADCEIDGTQILAGTFCEYEQTVTGTGCTDCWPAVCEPL